GKVGTTVQVETKGGPLTITLDGVAKMEGPAVTVFSGAIPF
ncbi:MAG: diaminopimelate epimerase, partial [Methanoregula sp.]|nr:diaminopimelate epimerase [Methanoregula sp.]